MENSVLEKMSLEELESYAKQAHLPIAEHVCRKAAAAGDQDAAVSALASVTGRGPRLRALLAVVDMYVNVIGDGFKVCVNLCRCCCPWRI